MRIAALAIAAVVLGSPIEFDPWWSRGGRDAVEWSLFLRDKAQGGFGECFCRPSPCCNDVLDMDRDGDVDLRDFAKYSNWLSKQAEEVVTYA